MDLNEKKSLVESIIKATSLTLADAQESGNESLQRSCHDAIAKAYALLSDIEGDIAELDSALGRVTQLSPRA